METLCFECRPNAKLGNVIGNYNQTYTKMAKTKKVEETSLVSENPDIPKPKLTKLIIKNYRCIGNTPVEIDLNDIVVLVGANNVGKSSILKAYELAMSQGSAKANLNIQDFPNNKIDPNNLPEIEIHTRVYDNAPGDKWIQTLPNGDFIVKEKFTWEAEGKPKDKDGTLSKMFG